MRGIRRSRSFRYHAPPGLSTVAPWGIRTRRCSARASTHTFPHAQRRTQHGTHLRPPHARFPARALALAGPYDPSPRMHMSRCTRTRAHTGTHKSTRGWAIPPRRPLPTTSHHISIHPSTHQPTIHPSTHPPIPPPTDPSFPCRLKRRPLRSLHS